MTLSSKQNLEDYSKHNLEKYKTDTQEPSFKLSSQQPNGKLNLHIYPENYDGIKRLRRNLSRNPSKGLCHLVTRTRSERT